MSNTFVSFFSLDGDSIVSGPVPVDPFVPDSGNIFPKMVNQINDAAWELWQFDGLAANGKTAVTVSFYRDTRTLTEGGFHAELNAIWPDGTSWGEKLFFEESVITSEGDFSHTGKVHGVWKSDAASVTFRIAADLSVATLQFSVPGRVTGTLELSSLSSRSDSRLPATDGAAKLGSSVHYIYPLGPCVSSADLVFDAADDTNRRTLILKAENGDRGGFVRGWSSLAWPHFMTDAYYICGTAGPYMLQLIRIVSTAADDYKPSVVARLYHNTELVCAANQIAGIGAPELQEDAVVVEKVLDGERGLKGAFRDKNVGYVIEFVKGDAGKKWRFETRHKVAWWSDYTSDQGTGKSGFIEALFGGSQDGPKFEGFAGAGQLQLP
ncbi:hypothetical protein N7507_006526 [Penicillium longicatenatum]|nr:hypothetical protein N7507_006526 [Penicillium longicatenatum]